MVSVNKYPINYYYFFMLMPLQALLLLCYC